MNPRPGNLDHPPGGVTAPLTCVRCGHQGLVEERVSSVLWHDGGLAVIRGIPAHVCPACQEEHISREVAQTLERMRADRFRSETAFTTIEVPVFRFAGGPRPVPGDGDGPDAAPPVSG